MDVTVSFSNLIIQIACIQFYESIRNNISPWRCLVNHFTLIKQVQEREVATPMANFVELCRRLKTGKCLFISPMYLMVFQEAQ